MLEVWTHGTIQFDAHLILLMLVYATVGGIWHIPRVLLMATNQHSNLAYWTLGAAFICAGLSWVLGHAFGLLGVATAMVLSELCIGIVCVSFANSALQYHQSSKVVLQ